MNFGRDHPNHTRHILCIHSRFAFLAFSGLVCFLLPVGLCVGFPLDIPSLGTQFWSTGPCICQGKLEPQFDGKGHDFTLTIENPEVKSRGGLGEGRVPFLAQKTQTQGFSTGNQTLV